MPLPSPLAMIRMSGTMSRARNRRTCPCGQSPTAPRPAPAGCRARRRAPAAGAGIHRRGHIAAFAQHRLDDDGGSLVRGGLALEEQIQLAQGKRRRLCLAPPVVEGVGEGRHEDRAGQRLIVVAVGVLGGGHGHRLVGAAVEAALKDHDVAPVGGHARQLHCRFHRLGAAVGEEKAVDRGRRHLVQQLHQAQRRWRNDDVHLAEDQVGRLLLDGLHHPRMAVAGVGHADAGGEVRVLLAGGVVQIDALAPHWLHLGHVCPDWRKQIDWVAHSGSPLNALERCGDRINPFVLPFHYFHAQYDRRQPSAPAALESAFPA